ncbi:hypothetical protein A4H97_22260 [Niastella yeongjuensis]|uniref:DUF4254 domain-containing protein n=1 Tax=Niastella yeongjuensis TaxID=354355 RepID=A0A1V9F776_9BACT|nr:DUF4254 domain-containing protein [Niastella yeongjuensis]OQP54224.1 hypothetical protein A4H97_22260 [Niastella yeongjuensis]SEP31695.1 Protein of unknown function [Niastella yeongjuensis]
MEQISQQVYNVFVTSIKDYHIYDDVNAALHNPYEEESSNALFYIKNWIDTVQWHLEDIIRDPHINSNYALSIKRRIDTLNQKRTDTVEQIDDYFQRVHRDIVPEKDARHSTESLGWAIDRLSILALKEFHWEIELNRKDAPESHIDNCLRRKKVLIGQKEDLMTSINWLIEDIRSGKKINKVYRQLKMYNDPSLNPVLYRKEAQN